MKKILNEFKKFISKGHALDLAVGVVVGGAFSKIVSSLVNDVIMPLIGVIIGGIDFTNLSLKVGEATVNYGMFIQNIIDFLIISFCIFLVVKTLNTLNDMTKKKFVKEEKVEKKEEEKVSEEILLLREINNSLKKQNKNAKKVKISKEKPKNVYYVHHGAKIRYIDPLFNGKRISKCCKLANKMIKNNLSYNMDNYVYLNFNF